MQNLYPKYDPGFPMNVGDVNALLPGLLKVCWACCGPGGPACRRLL